MSQNRAISNRFQLRGESTVVDTTKPILKDGRWKDHECEVVKVCADHGEAESLALRMNRDVSGMPKRRHNDTPHAG